MGTVRKITNELAIAGQLTLDELQQLGEAGYQAVVNLRSVNEIGFLKEEQQKIECLGLRYVHLSIQVESLTLDQMLPVIQQLKALPKPLLVHCDNGIRASMMVLMHIAIEQGMAAEEAFQKAAQLGLFKP